MLLKSSLQSLWFSTNHSAFHLSRHLCCEVEGVGQKLPLYPDIFITVHIREKEYYLQTKFTANLAESLFHKTIC